MLYDGTVFRTVATRGYPGQYAALVREPFPPGVGHQALIRGDRLFHVPDMHAVPSEPGVEARLRLFTELGLRTGLSVPLRKDGVLLGIISAARLEVRPFSDKEIALLENFAAQAVIAMENARLITELREALEQQTATAEVLQVINASPGDLTPVFDAILEKAHSLCGAVIGSLLVYDGEHFRAVAGHGHPEGVAAYLATPFRPNVFLQRLVDGEPIVHVADFAATAVDPEHGLTRGTIENTRVRSSLWVPLRKDGALLGCISAFREEVRPFGGKEIALLENFAAQAVIAMENARLLTELRLRTADLQELLEYQTATSDVLKVISRSAFDLNTVLQTVLTSAVYLCQAERAILYRYRDGKCHFEAGHNNRPEDEVYERSTPIAAGADTVVGRTMREKRAVQILDALHDPDYNPKDQAELNSARSMLGVPLLRDGELIGVLALARTMVAEFTERQVELITTFADQAVIAIENARLLTEQREALEQQTATAEVLQVINGSPGDLAPVFDAILEKAHSLCDVVYGSLELYDGEHFRSVAEHGLSDEFARVLQHGYQAAGSPASRPLIDGRPFVHVADAAQVDHPVFRSAAEREGIRTVLFVPLRRDDALLGMIASARREVRPFSDKQIALLQNFAAQAVIAIENARLLGELRARTDELAQRQAELRITFENMGDGVAMFDETPRLVAWNHRFLDLLDVPDAILVERRTYADYIRYLTERGEFGPGVAPEDQLRRFQERAGEHYALERTRPDGRVIEVRHNPVPGGGFVLIYADITERKRSEAEIRAARDAAETALRDLKAAQASLVQAEKMASLGQLTAGIAHEIKNPLNFVNNFSILSVELLDELKQAIAPAVPALGEDARSEIDQIVGLLTSNLEKITEHGQRADGIVRGMLDHSRGGTGEQRTVDLNTLVEEALNLVYHGARAQDQNFNITLQRDLGAGIAPIELVPQDVTRVLLNLFSNGCYAARARQRDAAGPGFEPVLKVATRDLGDAVEIRVWDNGVGIPDENRDRLFQPFFTTKAAGEGTGLGLSISYDIITQRHGGTITVDSRVGEHSEFTVRIPRNR